MDQDSNKGTEKRNWRERLGIGVAPGSAPAGALPRIGDEFKKPKATPDGKATPVVKPAPMAPRPVPRAAAPAAPDRLAEKLRSQREAQAKLAEQRVQVARQRSVQPPPAAVQPPSPKTAPPPSEAVTAAPPPAAESTAKTPKPKFTFADDHEAPAPTAVPPLIPPRPPLGMQPQSQPQPLQQKPAGPPPQSPPYPATPNMRPGAPGYSLTGFPQPPFSQQQFPPFRPIDPATGYPAPAGNYVPPPGYAPPRTFTPAAPMSAPNNFGPAPRFNVQNRAPLNPNYAPRDVGALPTQPGLASPNPRLAQGQARPPQMSVPRDESVFADQEFYPEATARPGRRPASDYQQAYRDLESGFEEEAPRSRGPWILLALLLLALAVAFAGVWFYQSSVKPLMTPTQTNSGQVPEVTAPAGEAKVQPAPVTTEPAGQAPVGKKRIYDRIVGDQEILGGNINPSEEVPLAPAQGTSEVPEPVPAGESSGPGLGDDSAPLPIPPPPGDGNTQGALPLGNENQSASFDNTAADNSSAAVAVSGAPVAPPAPGETIEPASEPAATAAAQEPMSTTPPSAPVIATTPKPVKKPVVKKTASTSLGSKPVVLVPPGKKAAAAATTSLSDGANAEVDVVSSIDNTGLYGDEGIAVLNETPPQPAPGKKKKTLADLFNNSDDESASPPALAEAPPAPSPVPAKPKPAPPAPSQTQVASVSGYAVQLASFRTREEASTAFSRLKSRHGSILGGLTPVISTAEVAGSTRYRLSVGGLATREQASALCAKLIAAGQRDCLVKRQ